MQEEPRNTDTKQFTSSTYRKRAARSSASARVQRRRRRRLLIALAAVFLVLLAATALVLVIVDIIVRRNASRPDETTEITRSALNPSHPTSDAYDDDDATYMESEGNQTAGSYIMLNLEEESNLMYVDVLSYDDIRYIRSAEVQVSTDGENWSSFGEFTGRPLDSTPTRLTKGSAVRASYVRLILTSGADHGWILNTLKLTDPDDKVIKPRSGLSGILNYSTELSSVPEATTSVSEGYVEITLGYKDLHSGDLILVDSEHEYVFPQSSASILPMYGNRTVHTNSSGQTVYSYQIGDVSLSLLEARVLEKFNAMCDAYYMETGSNRLHVGANAGYRSRETQADLAARYPDISSPAGFSEHNTGLAVNIDLLDGTSVYKLDSTMLPECASARAWLNANAYKYGFIDRYPPEKDSVTKMTIDRFHYRYVGYPHAFYMTRNGLCLEEYLAYLKTNAAYGSAVLRFDADNGKTYEVCFVPASPGDVTNVPVPEARTYTVSGNNADGFIVTVEK